MSTDDLIILISKYLLFNEYKNISFLNNYINKSLFFNIPLYIKLEYLNNNLEEYPSELIKILNPFKLYKIPKIKIKRYFIGDYIDFLDKSYFINSNIVRGIDKYNRPFISILYNKEKSLITTLFQRYTDDKYRWVTGGPNICNGMTIIINFDLINSNNDDAFILLNQIKSFT